MDATIGFVEDDDVIRANFSDYLRGQGFRVDAFCNRKDAIAAFRQSLPDIAILDVGLGHERDGGFQLCMELRRLSRTVPILFLTSFDGEADKISGLRLGADDYLSKESSFDLLVVRIETLLRRYEALHDASEGDESGQTVGDLRIDRERSKIYWKGSAVDLPLTQFWMVEMLAKRLGGACNHSELMRAAKIVVEPNTIAAHVKGIRQHFRDIDPDFDAIRTERGLGYRWMPD